jgi:hypothetical protein
MFSSFADLPQACLFAAALAAMAKRTAASEASRRPKAVAFLPHSTILIILNFLKI